ncbi:MAG: hypothetical protein AMJ38_05240 [Dehalococcoidia bacterium DG_22]|nr:MAG: hypothetical protein AMJ38_05240 [Dehalococcoidia bacterium DG_22]
MRSSALFLPRRWLAGLLPRRLRLASLRCYRLYRLTILLGVKAFVLLTTLAPVRTMAAPTERDSRRFLWGELVVASEKKLESDLAFRLMTLTYKLRDLFQNMRRSLEKARLALHSREAAVRATHLEEQRRWLLPLTSRRRDAAV